MITSIECLPCLVRQAIDTAKRVGMPPSGQQTLVQEALHLLSTVDLRQPAPVIGQRIQRLIREMVQQDDPYRAIKAESNALAMERLPFLRETVQSSDDPLATATRVAIAGNIIDYGAKRDVDAAGIEAALSRALAMPLDEADLAVFRQAVTDATSILYLADNAGEIVFDRVLIECLPREKVTLVVRGAPVINDATLIDAAAAGLDRMVEVIDNGSDIPGTVVAQCTSIFQSRFVTADVVIAKGQGNYETLADVRRPIFYLFVAKCPIVADQVGCAVDTPIFYYLEAQPHLQAVQPPQRCFNFSSLRHDSSLEHGIR